MASLEVTKTEWKTAIVENRRLELYQKKLEMRQEQREREKALVEELQISDDGESQWSRATQRSRLCHG